MCTELGKISEGYGDKKGTSTVKFLTHDEIRAIPKDRTITYARIVVDYRKQKKDPNRVCITVGGNLLKKGRRINCADCRPNNNKNDVEQRDKYSRSKIYVHRHQKFLPLVSIGA